MSVVLAFGPHPDDLEIFMGGTLQMHIAKGDIVHAVVVTDGAKGAFLKFTQGAKLIEKRKAESSEALSVLGVNNSHYLNIPDSEVTESCIEKFTKIVETEKPDIIYCPEFEIKKSFYLHSDHIKTGFCAISAAKKLNKDVEIRLYHTKKWNMVFNISQFNEKKRLAISKHKSQYSLFASPPLLLWWFTVIVNLLNWNKTERFRVEKINSKS